MADFESRYGTVRGTVEDGLVVLRGLRYAAAPVGELRLAPAQPPLSWEGVRPATSFGSVSIQPPPSAMDSIPGDPVEQSEDCLFLNVWTPGLDNGLRPVMVFIHGGGFLTGSSSVSVYHGAALARHGAVVVTFNYRLGALGWLAHPGLATGAAGFGNWGLSDQIQALSYVREHAALLGGDPENVTIFGESAGAMSVAALLGCADARPLYRKAIIQSGAAVSLTTEEAVEVAEEFVEIVKGLGVAIDSLSLPALRDVPAETILAAQRQLTTNRGPVGLPFQPVVDGGLLTVHTETAIADGAAAGIDLMIGTNLDEWKFFTLSASAREIDDARLHRLVRRHLRGSGLDHATTDELIEAYTRERSDRDESVEPADLYTALGTDWVFRVPSARLAEAQSQVARVYCYLFDFESAIGAGACHALELPFVFGTTDNPFVAFVTGAGEEVGALSTVMQRYWFEFAAAGAPAPAAEWPQYSAPERMTRRLGRSLDTLAQPMEGERVFMDKLMGVYGMAAGA